MNMETLEELKQQEKELTNLLVENRGRQRELNRIAFVQEYNADIGDTIEWLDGRTRRKGVIVEIEFSGVTPYYYRVQLFNADGNLGKRITRVWSPSSSQMKIISRA